MSDYFYNFNNLSSISSLNNEVLKGFTSLSEQKEAVILSQLNELISRGLIVIEQTEPVITTFQEHDGKYTMKVSQAVRLVPKEFDYIKQLEEEVKTLKEQLATVRQVVKDLDKEKK